MSNRLSKFTCLIFINKNSPVLGDFPFPFLFSCFLSLSLLELNVLGKYSADVCGNQSALPHPPRPLWPATAPLLPAPAPLHAHAHTHAWQAQLNGRNAFSFPFYQVFSFFFFFPSYFLFNFVVFTTRFALFSTHTHTHNPDSH